MAFKIQTMMGMIMQLAENVFLQKHPLSLVGCQFGRNVTLIRLANRKLVIHSTAHFSEEDVQAIRRLGEPSWLLEATRYHDTLAEKGRAVFPNIPYLIPPKFPNASALNAQEIHPKSIPDEWAGELELIAIEGAPKLSEYALYHCSSKTLILADLIFNPPPTMKGWTRFFIGMTSGIKAYPGVSRLWKFYIKDHDAFIHSMHKLEALDFERIVVAHGEPIEDNAKSYFRAAMNAAGFTL